MDKVCVLGLGYIGLPTASVLATNGYTVVGVDVNAAVVETVNGGGIHIEEPGLQTVVRAATVSGNLRAAKAPEAADVFILAVPTPLSEDKKADMHFVTQAAAAIVPVLRAGNLIILESTSPPGTCRDLIKPILEESGFEVGKDIYLAHCPERVLPGKILHELIHNDRVIGGYTRESAEKARALYAQFVEGAIFLTDVTTAEMVKLIENTYRDVNIALANETALMCEELGISFWDVARFANRHPRVQVHSAGPGVGGHCISVDPWFLVDQLPETTALVRMARERNSAMPQHVVQVIQDLLAGVAQPKVAALGLAYKGNVDDVRESPSLQIVALLEAAGVNVMAHDPYVKSCSVPTHSLEAVLEDADLAVILTDHDQYKAIDPAEAAQSMRNKMLFDTRHCLNTANWRLAGFHVRVLGVG